MRIFFSLLVIGFLASSVFFVAVPRGATAAFSDGTLLRAESDYAVYYIEAGKKRRIESADAFRAQGFRWEDVRIVNASELSLYLEGERVSADSLIVLPGEAATLSDLAPFPASDIRLATHNGRTILRFSSIFWNQGGGPLELIADPESLAVPGDVPTRVSQRIQGSGGTYRDRSVGIFVWHAVHNHYHYNEFLDYLFETKDGEVPAVSQKKSTRCIGDWRPTNLSLPGAPQSALFPSCARGSSTRARQGLSIGWADVYNYTLADQYLDVHDVPPGTYRLSIIVNAARKLVESRLDNNTSIVILKLDVPRKSVEVVASAGPFLGAPQSFAAGMLIRGDADSKVYAMQNNKKRWIRSAGIFASYGYSWDRVEVLPQGIVDAIPFNNLIRADGRTVFALNDEGFKRPIMSAEIFNSYGFSWSDVADINGTEFSGYSDANLIRRAGDEQVYYIHGNIKRLVKNQDVFRANNFDSRAIHVANDFDFNSYMLGQEITGTL